MIATNYYERLSKCASEEEIHKLVSEILGIEHDHWINPARFDRRKKAK